MTQNADRLYQLLPAVYRQQDAETGWQLQALLRVIAEQVQDVEDDIKQLYENWFIETCQDWVVPYIGDLIGYQQVHEAGEPSDVNTPRAIQRNKILISRREVANTIRYRRRKGTLSLLKTLATDVAGWPYVSIIEFYKLLNTTQNSNYEHDERGRSIDVRDSNALYYMGSPFAKEAHTVDVRRITSHQATGRYNIPSVGLFIWRLKPYSVTRMLAHNVDEEGDNSYTFSILGNDVQLYTLPNANAAFDEFKFPIPIGLRAFKKHKTDYYGEGNSFQIWTIHDPYISGKRDNDDDEQDHMGHRDSHRHGHDQQQSHHDARKKHRDARSLADLLAANDLQAVAAERIIPTNLSNWKHYRPAWGQVAVDPTRGRIVFPPGHEPEAVIVSYHYAFSADIGGGEYHRPLIEPIGAQHYTVAQLSKLEAQFKTIQEALDTWDTWKEEHPELPFKCVIEILDNGVYTEQLDIELSEDENLHIRAADHKRPIIRLIDWESGGEDALRISGESGSRMTLDGLLIAGRAVSIEDELSEVYIRHCTLVPGWSISWNCQPQQPEKASLILENNGGQRVSIEHSILGSIFVDLDEVREDPIHIAISDSIVDATSVDLSAIGNSDGEFAHAILSITRCTVLGQIYTHAITLGENSIFQGQITVARRQIGCMRFSAIAEHSRTPRRYNCQPDLVEQAVDVQFKHFTDDEREAVKQRERSRVLPLFTSMRYGSSAYCQLACGCAPEIKRGADDESEMGVFHDLYQPQREANLRTRLDDVIPAGMEAGIIYMN